MFGSGHGVWKSYCVVPCLLLLGAFSGCSFAYAAPTAEQSAIIAEQTKVIEANPKDYKAYFRRGRAYFDAAQYSEADADCKSGLRINPESQHLWVLQANVALKMDESGRCLAAVRKAQSLGRSSGALAGLEVSCLNSMHRDRDCYRRCNEWIQVYPSEPSLYYFRALSGERLQLVESQILSDYKEAARLGSKLTAYQRAYQSAFLRYSNRSRGQ